MDEDRGETRVGVAIAELWLRPGHDGGFVRPWRRLRTAVAVQLWTFLPGTMAVVRDLGTL
jgi:hypothetical protein